MGQAAGASVCVGVLGGSGPLATAEFHRRLLTQCALRGARQDADFPRVVLSSVPVPGMDHTGALSAPSRAHLLDQALVLTAMGVDVLAVPCNTAHLAMADLPIPIPVVDMVAASVLACAGHTAVGVLSSRHSRRHRLHAAALEAAGITAVGTTESEQTELDTAIASLMGGGQPRQQVERLIQALHARGAQSVLLGCTELSLLGPLPGASDALNHLVSATLAATMTGAPTTHVPHPSRG